MEWVHVGNHVAFIDCFNGNVSIQTIHEFDIGYQCEPIR